MNTAPNSTGCLMNSTYVVGLQDLVPKRKSTILILKKLKNRLIQHAGLLFNIPGYFQSLIVHDLTLWSLQMHYILRQRELILKKQKINGCKNLYHSNFQNKMQNIFLLHMQILHLNRHPMIVMKRFLCQFVYMKSSITWIY